MDIYCLNTVTSFYILEELVFPLLVVIVSALLAVAIATTVGGCLRCIAKIVQSILRAPAIKTRKLFNDSSKIAVNVTPIQETSTDKGELVIIFQVQTSNKAQTVLQFCMSIRFFVYSGFPVLLNVIIIRTSPD